MAKKKLRKGKYKVINWPAYNRFLKARGDITFWFTDDSIKAWLENYSEEPRSRGRQRIYSDVAIKTVYIILQVFHLRLRQAERFVQSLMQLLGFDLPIPDYTTISKRIRKVSVDIISSKPKGTINLILDSTGLKMVGEKEWINYKYKLRARRVWRKLHIGVTDDGNIITSELTTLHASDIATVPDLLSQVDNDIGCIVGDGAYFKSRMVEYIAENDNAKDSKFVGPPGKGVRSYSNRLKVEETFSRYKRIIGNKLKAKHLLGQANETKLSLLILNKMKDIGMPKTIRVA